MSASEGVSHAGDELATILFRDGLDLTDLSL